jgi:hypothetical protein
MPLFELQTPDGKTYEVEAPDMQSAVEAIGQMAPQQAPEADPQQFARQAAGMNHQQMVEAYRATRPGDPWGDFLAQRLQQPMQGETPQQAAVRAGGAGSTDATNMSGTGKAAATFLQGVPFVGEYSDEALGAVAPYIGPNSAEDATRAIRMGRDDFEQQRPKTSLGLKIGGGVAGSIPALAVAPWYIPQTLGGQAAYGLAAGATLGAAEGAVSGYGSGTDDQSRGDNAQSRALIGGGLGGLLGTAAPFIGRGVTTGARWALDKLNLARQANQAGLSRPSYEIMTRAMDADGSLNGPGAQRLLAAGPDAMLADAGPNARTLLDATIQKSGKAGVEAGQAVERRATKANQIVTGALDSTLGRPQGIQTMETGIRQGSAAARGSAYDAAYNAPINYATNEGKNLQKTLRRVPGSVIAEANRLMQIEGVRSKQIMATIAPNGTVTYKRLPDVRQLDYITRAINQAAESGDGAGALGGQTTLGRAYQGLSRDIRQALRGLVPEYGVALDTAAEPIAARQALLFGEKLFNRGTSRDEVANTLAGMSQAERQQASAGLRSYIDEKLSNVTRAISDGNMDAREAIAAVRDLSSRANREKVAALVGPQEASRMFKAIDQATTALDLRAGVAQNSKTFARTEMDRTVRDYTDSGVLNAARSGEPLNAGKRMVQNLLGGTPEAKQAVSDKVYAEIARALVSSNPQSILGNLQHIAQQNPKNAAIARQIGSLLGGFGFAAPAYQAGTQALLGMGQSR